MPRKLRLEYEGAIYHAINRGDRREKIFLDDRDCQVFMETLAEACEKTGWQVHAYCLMENHFHLVIETPRANLSSGMQWLLSTYTLRFNRAHKGCGHLFSGRFKAPMVDGSGDGYLKTVCDYVHLNPVRAKVLKPEQRLNEYVWSSYGEYLKRPKRRTPWLRTDRLLGEWGIEQDNVQGRRQFELGMETRKAQEQNQAGDWKGLRRSWCIGAKEFREELLERLERRRGEPEGLPEMHESEEQRAERLVMAMLEKVKWGENDLGQRRKGDPVKLRMATELRKETTMSWRWIASRLDMGQWRSAANAVRLARGGF